MLLAACLLDPRERTSEPYSSVYCNVGTFPDFPFFFVWLFLPALQDNVQESRDQELIVFELIAESKMSVEWESPDSILTPLKKLCNLKI